MRNAWVKTTKIPAIFKTIFQTTQKHLISLNIYSLTTTSKDEKPRFFTLNPNQTSLFGFVQLLIFIEAKVLSKTFH